MSWGFLQLWTNNPASCHNSAGIGARGDVDAQEFDINRFVLRSAIAIGGVLSAICLFCAGVIIFFCAGRYVPTYDYVTEMPQPEEVAGVYYYSDAYRVETGGSDVEGGGQLILFPDGRLETRGGTLRICSQTLRIDSVIIPEPDAHGTWKLEDSQSVSITLKYELEEDSPDDFAEFWLVYDNDGEIAFLPNVDPSGLFPLLQRREPVPEHE